MLTTNKVEPHDRAVGEWLDAVGPFPWNTKRWLAEAGGFGVEWHLLSLAVLNEGQTLQPPAQARMEDSPLIGRLTAAIVVELSQTALAAAYFATRSTGH